MNKKDALAVLLGDAVGRWMGPEHGEYSEMLPSEAWDLYLKKECTFADAREAYEYVTNKGDTVDTKDLERALRTALYGHQSREGIVHCIMATEPEDSNLREAAYKAIIEQAEPGFTGDRHDAAVKIHQLAQDISYDQLEHCIMAAIQYVVEQGATDDLPEDAKP